ncbi:MAG: c-type cytochrome [Sulfurimonas sp.]|nr:c-type cytochrome [Sulfurimonas sp.]
MKTITLAIIGVSLFFLGCSDSDGLSENQTIDTKMKLGKALYEDTSLSKNRTMSCATCHHEESAFVDERESDIFHMAAKSADDNFIGDRNVPTASYASFTPDFGTVEEDGEILFVGGQFLDGRSKNLKEQAKLPFLNPIEMQMESIEEVIHRVRENDDYIEALKTLYSENIFDDYNKTFDAIADAIATFEKSDIFSPFDSKFDRHLAGTYILTAQEKRGMDLFEDEKRANCIACHPVLKEDDTAGLFTDFTYDNIGVPINKELRLLNGKGENFIDFGLFDNPDVNDSNLKGAFRVSTLRNIDETGPYMHNGIFKDLKTVVHFYNTRDVEGAINPETGEAWGKPEVNTTVNSEELGDLGLTDQEEDDIVAFMKTLTDKRYEK